MQYKRFPEKSATVVRSDKCGGYGVGIRNMILAALTEAAETDFRNSGDRQNFGSAEVKMWGLADWRVPREELFEEIVTAIHKALFYGVIGSANGHKRLPANYKPPTIGVEEGESPYQALIEIEAHVIEIMDRLNATLHSEDEEGER